MKNGKRILLEITDHNLATEIKLLSVKKHKPQKELVTNAVAEYLQKHNHSKTQPTAQNEK